MRVGAGQRTGEGGRRTRVAPCPLGQLRKHQANEAADGFVDFVCGEGARTPNPITDNTFGEDVDSVVESNGFGLVGRCRDVVTGDARAGASVREVSVQPAGAGDTP